MSKCMGIIVFGFAVFLTSTSLYAENLHTNFEVSKLKSLSCVATNVFGVSQMRLASTGTVNVSTNGFPSQLRIHNIGNNPALGIGYINMTGGIGGGITSLVFGGQYLESGEQTRAGSVFIGQINNPFQPVYSGTPWAAVTCQISLQ